MPKKAEGQPTPANPFAKESAMTSSDQPKKAELMAAQEGGYPVPQEAAAGAQEATVPSGEAGGLLTPERPLLDRLDTYRRTRTERGASLGELALLEEVREEVGQAQALKVAARKLVNLDARHRTFLEDALTWPTDAEFDAWAAEFHAVYSELAALASPAAAEAGAEGGEEA